MTMLATMTIDDAGVRMKGATTKRQYKIKIEQESVGVAISIPGFGTSDMEPGAGPVIYLEMENGEPILRVWADIKTEEPTHKISLKGASEALRVN